MPQGVNGSHLEQLLLNGSGASLVQSTTDAQGRYIFEDARLPIQRRKEGGADRPYGSFQVFGTAPGFGFTWHGMRGFCPTPRPADSPPGEAHIPLYLNEPLIMNLTFGSATKLEGRIANESGKPVPRVLIRLQGCDYLDTAGNRFRYYLVWITKLPPGADHVQISEIRLFK